REHLHDAPAIMTGPLVALGVLTVIGGVINLPAFAGGGHGLETWLGPVLRPATERFPLPETNGAVEYTLIAAAVVIALVGLVLGRRQTLARPIPTAREALPETGFAAVLFHKYYVDEIYHRVIVAPVVGISRVLLWRLM